MIGDIKDYQILILPKHQNSTFSCQNRVKLSVHVIFFVMVSKRTFYFILNKQFSTMLLGVDVPCSTKLFCNYVIDSHNTTSAM